MQRIARSTFWFGVTAVLLKGLTGAKSAQAQSGLQKVKRGRDKLDGERQHLTLRDGNADTLEDLFDFENSLSLNTPVNVALPPATDRTPR